MKFGDAIQRRVEILRKRQAEVEKGLTQISRESTIRAIEAATEKTPPVADDLAGTNTRSGEMKQHWAIDSKIEPIVATMGTYITILANEKDYASYVNNGHRMDKHFVPGLVLDPETEKLERVDPSEGGIVVGTKTTYVPGIFAAEAGIDAFEKTALQEMGRLPGKVYRD